VPWAADRIADEDPFRERSAVMRAGRPDCENVPASASEDHRFTRDLAEKHPAVGDFRSRYADGEVRTGRCFGFLAHNPPAGGDESTPSEATCKVSAYGKA